MATIKGRASNIDETKPIVTKTFIITDKCDHCGQAHRAKLEMTANEKKSVTGEFKGECLSCGRNMKFIFSIKMPRKV